jgi:hypothetical protein
VDLNVTVPQEVVQDFLKRNREWNGDEETTPYLYLSSEDTGYKAEAHHLAADAILVGVPLQYFIVAMVKSNNDPYQVWFTLIRNAEGVWEQGRRTKVTTFEESMKLMETQGYRNLLRDLRAS